MWFKGRVDTLLKFIVSVFAVNMFKGCEAITNAGFNEQIRSYSVVENNYNLSDVKTLQKHELGLSRYANSIPSQNPIIFKDTGDSAVLESSHARGLLHHGSSGLGFDYEDPSFGHHGYDYPVHENHHDLHNYHHYDHGYDSGHHHPPAHHGYGHHKFYDHGLAHKALLWPIAGIALLGAAAALVSNPVLLQLGVVSGKRKRRHVENIENTAKKSFQKWSQITNNYHEDGSQKDTKKRILRKKDFKVGKRVLQSSNRDELQFETEDNDPKRNSDEDRRFIPIPLKIRKL